MYMAGISDEAAFDKMAATMGLAGVGAKLKCPTLITQGENDFLCPLEGADKFFDEIAGPKEMWIFQDEFHPLGGVMAHLIPWLADWVLDALDGKFPAGYARRIEHEACKHDRFRHPQRARRRPPRRADRHRLRATAASRRSSRISSATRRPMTPDGCLCCGGLIETHIHLDKSRIIDRCAPETERMANAVKRVQGGEEDLHGRGRSRAREGNAGELHQAWRDAHAHACRGRPRRRHARLRRRAGAGRRIQMGDRHRALRVSAGGPHQQSRHRRAAGRRR